MAASKKVQTGVLLDPDKYERLKKVATELRIPVAVLIRDGIDRVLDLAEKQQATTDRYWAEQGKEPPG